MRIKFQWLLVSLALFLGRECFADDNGVTLQTGGTKIILSKGWERLDQAENFFVQKRAINKEQRIAMGAGAFTIDLTLEQYVALGIYGIEQGPQKGMEQAIKRIVELTHIPKGEIEKAVQSRLGQQTIEQINKASSSCSFEFLSATNIEISGAPAFEIHSKITILQSKQTAFTRQFVYQGTEPKQIIQVTFSGGSDDIFQDKSLIDSVKRAK